MSIRVAINGFGRIGRVFLRTIFEQNTPTITIVAINLGPTTLENSDTLFAYDSVMGRFNGTVTQEGDTLSINGTKIKLLTISNPQELPWKDLNIDWVVEASGRFTKRNDAAQHLIAGAKKVLITAPAVDADVTIVPGINDATYQPDNHHIVSLGSCTTNCFAPLIKVLHETFIIQSGIMTTVHAYTNNQVTLDSAHKDPRRGRAAALNIIPTKTGANKVITKLFPDLEGKLSAIALRVPVPDGSLVDFAFTTQKPISIELINGAFKKYSETTLNHFLSYSDKPLVSSDFIKNPSSAIFDSTLTQSVGNMGKVFAWYDNEFGYSSRLRDFLLHS